MWFAKERAFSRGWETPNDRFPLPVAQSLTQFYLKFVVFFLSSLTITWVVKWVNDERWSRAAVGELWACAEPPVLRLWMQVSELVETAALLQKELQGGFTVGTGHRAWSWGNPFCSGSGGLSLSEGCPCARVRGEGGRQGPAGPRDTC